METKRWETRDPDVFGTESSSYGHEFSPGTRKDGHGLVSGGRSSLLVTYYSGSETLDHSEGGRILLSHGSVSGLGETDYPRSKGVE